MPTLACILLITPPDMQRNRYEVPLDRLLSTISRLRISFFVLSAPMG